MPWCCLVGHLLVISVTGVEGAAAIRALLVAMTAGKPRDGKSIYDERLRPALT